MAARMPELTYTCEICGQEGLNDEAMRAHMMSSHIKGASSCLFCEFSEASPDELLIHINTAHLDYLTPTPEDELYDFIDDDKFDEPSTTVQQNYHPVKNINANFNNNNNVNNNGENSTRCGGGAEGSPLRTQLNLNLTSSVTQSPSKSMKSHQCMMCGYTTVSPKLLEEHINRDHFDLTSPTLLPSSHGSPEDDFRCPLCVLCFPNPRDLEFHVNMEHRDILSPAKVGFIFQIMDVILCLLCLIVYVLYLQSTPGSIGNWNDGCPVCNRSLFSSNQEMISHIEEHFNTGTPTSPDLSSDRLLAKEIETKEKESMRQREQREFELLQAQYGMDNQGNFKEQSLTNMQKAVYAGEMSVSDFYERQIGLRLAENNGIDDGSSCTKDLIPKIKAISQMSPKVLTTLTCTTVDHYASTYGDKGWGCGYRLAGCTRTQNISYSTVAVSTISLIIL